MKWDKNNFMAFNFKQYTANNPLLKEDGDNVTAADNAAYSADQEIGEPLEEQEIDVFNNLGDKFEALRDEMSQIYAAASESDNQDWMRVLNVAAKHLDKLEGVLAQASAKLGVLPRK
jgi:hypothetical protein